MLRTDDWQGRLARGTAQPKVTVRDVARAAGLSVASVSRGLSGARPVRADIARRVAEAAEVLGYARPRRTSS